MMNGLPVRADRQDVFWFMPGFAKDGQRRARKFFSQQEVELANFAHRPMETYLHKVLAQGRRERLLNVFNKSRVKLLMIARDLCEHGLDTICRGPGHQTNEETTGFTLHARRISLLHPKEQREIIPEKLPLNDRFFLKPATLFDLMLCRL